MLVVPYGDPHAYLERYRADDKAHTGLGAGVYAWAVPYWLVDASFATMVLLLACVDSGLGACFFGQFDHERAVREVFGVPAHLAPVGTVAIGHPDDHDRPSQSARRGRLPVSHLIHRGQW